LICIILIILSCFSCSFALELKDFFYRADNFEIKLTFKFDNPVTWKEVSPDPYRIALDIEGVANALSFSERPMNIGPLRNIMIRSSEPGIRIWCELSQPAQFEVFDESNGRLLTILLKGPFSNSQPKENMFSFDFRDASVRDVLMALAKSAGVNIVVDDSVEGTISLAFEGLSFDQALGYILKVRGLEQVKLGNNIIIGKKETLEENFDLLTSRRFTLKYTDPDTAASVLSMYISEPNRISKDPVTRSLLVRGREEELTKAEEVLKTIDVALETKIFPLNNNLYEGKDQLDRIVQLIKIIVPDENRISLNYTLNENIAMSEEKIRVPVGNPYIVVQGTQEELEAVGELISNIDRKLPQIMIEAKIVEINRNKTKDLGVSWFVGDQEGQISFGEMSLGGTMERQDLVSIRIQALEKKNLGRLVGNPRILTLSGKTAVISVGEKVPYRDIVADSEGNKSFPIKWLDVGVKMGVTPEVTQDGFIILHVFPKVSTFVEREYVLEGLTFKDPQPSEKSADTTARLRAGETLVIGGLIKSSDMETVTKIPLLGEIPIIGELFTLRKKTHEETELIIFLTPSLVAY
jgi:type II secretory pathway component GspD/PulD (secretin)